MSPALLFIQQNSAPGGFPSTWGCRGRKDFNGNGRDSYWWGGIKHFNGNIRDFLARGGRGKGNILMEMGGFPSPWWDREREHFNGNGVLREHSNGYGGIS